MCAFSWKYKKMCVFSLKMQENARISTKMHVFSVKMHTFSWKCTKMTGFQ